jgi:hypothetical protein
MNFNKAGKYLSLTLLVLAILSMAVGVSVAAGENSSSTEAVDFNNYTSYYNYSTAVNVDHKTTYNLTNNLNNSNFNISGTTNVIIINLNNYTDFSEDNIVDVFDLSNENPVNTNVSDFNCKFNSTQTNISQIFSEQLFNNSDFYKYWDELIELKLGSHNFMARELLISNPLNRIHYI